MPAVPAGVEFSPPDLVDAAVPAAVHAFTVVGMRLVSERHDQYSGLLLTLFESAVTPVVTTSAVQVPTPDSRELWMMCWNPWALSSDAPVDVVAPMPVLCLLDHSLGADRVNRAFLRSLDLLQRGFPLLVLHTGVAAETRTRVVVERMSRELCRLGAHSTYLVAGVPSWRCLVDGLRALVSGGRAEPPWFDMIALLRPVSRRSVPLGAEVDDEDRPASLRSLSGPPRRDADAGGTALRCVLVENLVLGCDTPIADLPGVTGAWIAADATGSDLLIAVRQLVGGDRIPWRFHAGGHAVEDTTPLRGIVVLRATALAPAGAPRKRPPASPGPLATWKRPTGAASSSADAAREDPRPQIVAASPPAPATRTVCEDANPPEHPPQLTESHPARVPVLADGRCLYYCVAAARDAVEWLATHDERGHPGVESRWSLDREAADAVRDGMVAALRAKGDSEEADRLMKPGVEGYPGLEDIPALATSLRGQVVVQSGPTWCEAVGEGPVRLHVAHTISRDGANNVTNHWELVQSWMAPGPSAPERELFRTIDPIDSTPAPPATDARERPSPVAAANSSAVKGAGENPAQSASDEAFAAYAALPREPSTTDAVQAPAPYAPITISPTEPCNAAPLPATVPRPATPMEDDRQPDSHTQLVPPAGAPDDVWRLGLDGDDTSARRRGLHTHS